MPFCISIAQRTASTTLLIYEDAVTRPLDDAAVIHGYGGIDQIASQRSEAGKCPLLVGPGKLAESDHIRRKKAASFRVSAAKRPKRSPSPIHSR